jgi:hypothetical protein
MPILDRRLSANPLPLPVVLVIGDEESYFSGQAWVGVEAAHAEQTNGADGPSEPDSPPPSQLRRGPRRPITSLPPVDTTLTPDEEADVRQTTGNKYKPIIWDELIPVLNAPHAESIVLVERQGWGPEPRPATRRPVPLQLIHEHEPATARLHEQIRRILDLFDVWGVIATASAGQVEPVRAALQGIDIPLLVTTDSTTVPAGAQPPNELRLMPSNRSQARTMLSTALLAAKVDRENRPGIDPEALMGPPRIACFRDVATQAREYVNDLIDELDAEAARLGLSLDAYDDHHDYDGPLIVVGYQSHAEHLLDKREPKRLTILSDGCATKRVYEAVERRLDDADAGYWFITRPHLTLRTFGLQAYSAMVEAGRELLTSEQSTGRSAATPEPSRRDRIKHILNRTDKKDFEFNGIENVALAYSVRPIALETDLRSADVSDSPNLRVVGGTDFPSS